eukprot:TRINITY_DN4190_c0_g2_i1.p1 TRINITY_DN4190_c0_g2~~TRINITY_DN4190_c0_g2_i1.p1  ORF type:complete len:253 (-),score=15.49 TRINITY_DN4190_c0_g2_i1:47-781(-)
MDEHGISRFSFDSLAEDVQMEIVSHLSGFDLISFRTMNKRLRHLITERKLSGKMDIIYPYSSDSILEFKNQFALIRPPLVLRRLTLIGNNQKLDRFFPPIPPSVESLALVDVTFEFGGLSLLPTGLLDLDLSQVRRLQVKDILSLPSTLTSLKGHLINMCTEGFPMSFPCRNIISMDLSDLYIPSRSLPQLHHLTNLELTDSDCIVKELTSLKKLVINDMDAKYRELMELPQNLVYFSYSPYKR